MAGVHVYAEKYLAGVRFDDHPALLSLWSVCQFGQSGLSATVVNQFSLNTLLHYLLVCFRWSYV